MDKQELVALVTLCLVLVAFPTAMFAYRRAGVRAGELDAKVFEVVAQVPEAGGWKPQVITVFKGDKVRLRITGRDVVHGFAIGQLGIDEVMILPGETETVEFVADRVGRYTIYCNVWCSPSHYRMRGTLEVVDPTAPGEMPLSDVAAFDPLDGLDIDMAHPADEYPEVPPSAVRGALVYERLYGPDLPGADLLADLRIQSPSAAYIALRDERLLRPAQGMHRSSTARERWDLVAYLWSLTTTPQRLEVGGSLYGKNCAACHGETGSGDGPGGHYLRKLPVAFTNAASMAGGTSQIYAAKVRRGGMGTGMPSWGAIFTAEELIGVVDYLWTFLFSGLDD